MEQIELGVLAEVRTRDRALALELSLVSTKLIDMYNDQSRRAAFYSHVADNTRYLNALYSDLNQPEVFSTLNGETLTTAFVLATKLTEKTDNSYKRLNQLHRFRLVCKRMLLS